MKVVILVGSLGTRIFEESQFKPKFMIEISDKPILRHIMKEYSYYEFNDFSYVQVTNNISSKNGLWIIIRITEMYPIVWISKSRSF